jgi:hypothetical protein
MLWARGLVDDADHAYIVEIQPVRQRFAKIEGEGADAARARRIRREDCGADEVALLPA